MDKNVYGFEEMRKKPYNKINHIDTLPIDEWVQEKTTLKLGTKNIFLFL